MLAQGLYPSAASLVQLDSARVSSAQFWHFLLQAYDTCLPVLGRQSVHRTGVGMALEVERVHGVRGFSLPAPIADRGINC